MVYVTLINEQNKRFDKPFSNEYLAQQFIEKIRYSKKLTYVGIYKED